MINHNPGRAALSLRDDDAAWLDQLLETAARGGDLRVMMRSPIASRVRGVVSRAKARAQATAHLRVARARGPGVADRVHAALVALGTANKHDIARTTGICVGSVGHALVDLRKAGRATVKYKGPWDRAWAPAYPAIPVRLVARPVSTAGER